jgi:diguanylate cyclase (GGDEF)-like protein
MPKFFPTLAGGALYMLNNSKNLFQEVGVWGKSLLSEKVFAPDECWALRRGRLHLVDDPGAEMCCRHVSQPLQAGCLCVPLMAQGEAMGILYLQATGLIPSDFKEPTVHIAATLAEGMALALANLKLREILRSQAIRDPLTGLFNRRYLEETLERELHRVKRLGSSLGVVMMDLDHFKEYNDTHGHEGGDAMLSAVGSLIKTHCREEDIPCRYGGEEFLLILSGASSEVTLGRAEKLRQAVKELQIQHRGRYINPTTMSLGVAVFPDQGATGEDLIRAADNALYLAKAEGRDRVVVANGNTEPGSFYLAQKAFS